MTVKLVIKSAAQTVDDFHMDCDLTWTIGEVKDKISETYPSNPKKESQKLIYGGKLLPDHLSLKSVLNPTHEKHIIHLVCPINVTSKQNTPKETVSSSSFAVPPPNPVFPPVNQTILNPTSFSSMPGVPVTPLNPGDAFQQYLAMQQMYAQFMTQYLSQFNGGVPPVYPNLPEMPAAMPVQTPQVPAPPQAAPPNPPQRQAEEEDHDYLDYMYIISRAVLLFAFLYYYSSFIRVFAVVTMFVILSLYKKMNRQNRQVEMQRRAAERQRNESAQTQPVPPADIQATESEVAAPSAPTTENEALSQQNEGRSIASVLSTTASLISAFFLSLFPGDPPVPVNVN